MSQQINLYQDKFRKKRLALGSHHVGAILVAGLAIVLMLTAHDLWRSYRLAQRLATAQETVTLTRVEVEEIRQRLRTEAPDPALVSQVERLETLVSNQKPLLELLQTQVSRSGGRYSEYFTALARQHVSGIWLTGIQIEGNGESMELRGHSISAALVPKYLQNLSAEAMISGTGFGHFQILGNDDSAARRSDGPVEFVIATTDAGGGL